MLPIPQDDELPKLIAIDPGTSNLGVAIFEFTPESLSIVSIEALTLVADKLHILTDSEYAVGSRAARLRALMACLEAMLFDAKPALLACEDAFFNPSRPNAFEALVECISGVKVIAQRYDYEMPVHLIRASVAKNAIGVAGGAGKEPVLAALLRIPEITDACIPDVTTLSEHAHDAIAIGYTALLKLRKGEPIRAPAPIKKSKKK
jgi:Holliday junction resolvasome RuvABC endonuclease subunit